MQQGERGVEQTRQPEETKPGTERNRDQGARALMVTGRSTRLVDSATFGFSGVLHENKACSNKPLHTRRAKRDVFRGLARRKVRRTTERRYHRPAHLPRRLGFNFGDQSCTGKVWELRIDVGPGCNVYYARVPGKPNDLVALRGGIKRSGLPTYRKAMPDTGTGGSGVKKHGRRAMKIDA